MSKLLRFFVVPFLLTVVVVGYSLLRLLNNPQQVVSSPVLSTQNRGQEKRIRKGKGKKQKLKQKKKLKRKERKKLINDAIATFPNQVSFLSTALSASDAKSMENAVELLNEYLPELGTWKFRAKHKSNTNLDGRSAGNIELNGNVLSEDEPPTCRPRVATCRRVSPRVAPARVAACRSSTCRRVPPSQDLRLALPRAGRVEQDLC